MALTRTRFIQADTTKAKLQDPITLLNSDGSVANVDVGFIVNRNYGVKSNVALVWSESGNTFVVAFTDDTGITNSNLNVSSYANVTAGTIIVNSLKTDNFLYANGNPFSAPAADYASTFVADNLSSGNAVFATARITGNLQVEGNIFTIGQQNLSISDAVIDLHTQANLAPWTFDDGKDIGLKFHYYKTNDEHAFLGRANNTGFLEWYDSGREVGNVFSGNTYGTIKSGELFLSNATVSSNNTTGAFRVSGGAGIGGRLNVGGNIVANSGTASSSTTTGAMIVRGGMGVSGDTYIGGALTAGSLQNTAIGTVTPNSGYFNDLQNTLTLKSGGNIVAHSGTASTNTTSGAVVVIGGIGVSGAINSGSIIQAGGNVVAASGTSSASTSTGALVVVGGAGVSGNIYSGSIYTSGLFWAGNNQSITGPATGVTGSLQFNNGGVLGGTNIIYDNATGNVVFADTTVSASTTTGAVVLAGGLGVGGNIFAGGLNGTIYGTLYIGTTDVNYNRSSASQTLTGVGIDGTAATATNAINTQVISNISAGTAYVTFVNATVGNLVQNLNTSLTYNPNSGNLRAFGIQTDTGVYWAGNGAAFSSAPGGSSGQLQYNNNNAFTGANIVFNNANGNLVITSTITSTSTTTGALVVGGGVGIAGALNILNTGDVSANVGVLFNGNLTTNANLGSFQTFSNANASTQATSINNINANLGAYQTFANANVSSLQNQITGANTNIQTTSANLGAFQSYANTKIGTNTNSNLVVVATTTSTSTTTGALVVAGGVGISGALYNGGIFESAGNIVAGATTVSTTATTGALVVRGGVGVSGNVFTAGWIVPTSNVTQNLGTTTQWWNVFYGVSTQARYADLAENYQADNSYEPGTVLSFGGNAEVTLAIKSHDTAVAGIVSTNPAHLMNSALTGENVVALALQGRVPCLVRGPVDKGTILVSSNRAGVAEAMNYDLFKPGCILGKSLETIPDDSIQFIEVVVGRF